MSTPGPITPASTLQPPILFVVDADDEARDVMRTALLRRFGVDYRIVTAESAQDGLATLQRIADQGDAVAMLAADLHLPGMDGIEFLERAHALHPGSVRVLLVAMDRYHTRLPSTELTTLQRATTLGQIDFSVVKGWVTPEEWLYPQVQEALSAWTITHRPSHMVYRMVGEQWDPRSHDVRDLLTRNGIPFDFVTRDSERGQQLITDLGIDEQRLPAVIRHDGSVLHNPSLTDLADAHGIQTRPSSDLYDLAIVGAGPAGLAAALCGASEGLHTIVLEPQAIGGQAGSSSLIRNYLGFPRGIGGGPLAHRAWEQAVLFGAQFVFTHDVIQLSQHGNDHMITLRDGDQVVARAVVIAAGVAYRRLGIPTVDNLVGKGVYYGAAGVEALALAGEGVCVVGGANSAGQAALHLAKFAAHVTLLLRGDSLAAGMSDYLVTQVMGTSNVEVRPQSRVTDGHGEARLQALTIEDARTGRRERLPTAALFVMIGAEPRTEWLKNVVALDERGFILTGPDLPPQAWPLARGPLPFETSRPGVFAAGDVRYGSIKRVAGAVGEGSVTTGFVGQYLRQPVASDRGAGKSD
jgi:thioredoxin reductase (NADPH)